MTEVPRTLVVGAGPAGARGAQAIRRGDPTGEIVVVSRDPVPFYNRILLSKEFLRSDAVRPEDVVLMPPEAFERLGIELRTGVGVTRLDPQARTATLDDGATLTFDKALVATGSRPLELPVPGARLPGVVTLRSLDDAVRLREAAAACERAVVVGGGLIGIEVSAALAARGLAVSLLAREPWLFGHLAPEPVGRALEAILERGGVDVRPGRTVTAIEEARDGLAVGTAEGETYGAPLVPVGIGVRYNVEFLEGTGLVEPGRGVRVDRWLETDIPGIFAAGDVAAFDDPVFGARHHVEHWLHAQRQGRHAGRNMTGDKTPFHAVSSYDTTLFGVPVTVVGAPVLATEWRVTEGDPSTGTGLVVGAAGGRPVAAFRFGPARAGDRVAREIEAGAAR